MAYLDDRMGVGTSRIDSPILTVEKYGYRPPGMAMMGVGMGIVDPATAAMAVQTAQELDKQLGIMDAFTGGLAAEAAQPAVGKRISETMNAITRDLLGYQGDSQRERRVFFRLGEILAKADPKVAAKGWAYAGYGNNTVNVANQEGSDFRTRTGRSGKILGLEGHLQPETVLGIRVEVGKQGELLSIMKSVLETATRFKVAFSAISTQDERQAVFAGCCEKWLGGTNWKAGMEFLPAPKAPSAAFMAVLSAPRGKGKQGISGGSGTVPPPPSSGGSGAIIAGVAALAGIYLLSKG